MKVVKDCGSSGCVGWGDVTYVIDNYLIYSKKSAIGTHFLDDGQFILQDGSLVMIDGETTDERGFLISVDINGSEKRPNAWRHDLFTFEVKNNKLILTGASDSYYDIKKYPYLCDRTGTNSQNGLACTYLALTDANYFKNLP